MNRNPSGEIKRIAFQKKKKKGEQIMQILPEIKARTFPYFSALKFIFYFTSAKLQFNIVFHVRGATSRLFIY